MHITCRLSGPDTTGRTCRSGAKVRELGRRSRRRQQPQAFPEVRRKAQIGLRPILNHRRRHRPFRSSCPRKCRRRLRRARHRIPPTAIRAHRTLGRGMAQARSHAGVRSRRCPGRSGGPHGGSIGTIRLGAAPRGGTRPSGQAGSRSAGELHPSGRVLQRPGSFSVPRRNDCRPDIHRPGLIPTALLARGRCCQPNARSARRTAGTATQPATQRDCRDKRRPPSNQTAINLQYSLRLEITRRNEQQTRLEVRLVAHATVRALQKPRRHHLVPQ